MVIGSPSSGRAVPAARRRSDSAAAARASSASMPTTAFTAGFTAAMRASAASSSSVAESSRLRKRSRKTCAGRARSMQRGLTGPTGGRGRSRCLGPRLLAPGDDDALELGEIVVRKAPEGAADVVLLGGDALPCEILSLSGQMQRVRAPVTLDRAALDEPGLDEAIDEARDVTLGNVETLGELLLRQALAFGQRREHVELRDRKPHRLELAGDRHRNPAVQAQEAEPDPQGVGRMGQVGALRGRGHVQNSGAGDSLDENYPPRQPLPDGSSPAPLPFVRESGSDPALPQRHAPLLWCVQQPERTPMRGLMQDWSLLIHRV